MRRRLAVGLVAFLFVPACLIAEDPARAPLQLSSPVQDKNYFILSLLERTRFEPADAALKDLLSAKQETLRTCEDAPCLLSKMRFTDDEISRAADALMRLYRSDPAVREMTNGPLRRSGTYIRYQTQDGDALLAAAWRDAALGINHVIDVYGAGTAPSYPDIDSLSFSVKSPGFIQMLRTIADVLSEEKATMFFQPSLRYALKLLEINRRDEAGRYEPLEAGENAAALRRIRTTSWTDFPYSLILVPGSGTDRPEWNLAPQGRLRLEIAVRRFKEGKAPFIAVSGGHVHPNQTAFCEAIEMKKALINVFGVPADRIIVDPHARHTTTNLRNVARLMYRYGIPLERKALITTDRFHSTYIESEGFAKRNQEELGYQPVKLLGRVSIFDLEFTPQVESLQIDATAPLDP